MGCAATMATLYNSPAIDGVKCSTTLYLGEFLLGTMPMFHVSIISKLLVRKHTTVLIATFYEKFSLHGEACQRPCWIAKDVKLRSLNADECSSDRQRDCL